MKPDDPPLESELPALATEIHYEFLMVDWLAGQLLYEPRSDDPGTALLERNAWLDSFLIHVRNVTHFLAGTPRKDDVAVRHYLPAWTTSMGGVELVWLEARIRPIHKRLAHITAYRRRVPKSEDAELIVQVSEAVATVYARFLAQLTVDQRAWFRLPDDDLADPFMTGS